MKATTLVIAAGFALSTLSTIVHAQHQHQHQSQADGRTFVKMPDELIASMLANMRDHLLAVAQIQEALSKARFDEAGTIAEQRLGMSSLKLHGAHEVAKHMPKGMQDLGTAMHRSASRFALAAQNASVTADVKPALAELSVVTKTCVACHATYRIH